MSKRGSPMTLNNFFAPEAILKFAALLTIIIILIILIIINFIYIVLNPLVPQSALHYYIISIKNI
jgi:hypothetical protein